MLAVDLGEDDRRRRREEVRVEERLAELAALPAREEAGAEAACSVRGGGAAAPRPADQMMEAASACADHIRHARTSEQQRGNASGWT